MATAQDIIDSATLKLGLRVQGTAFNTYNSDANDDAFVVLQDLVSKLTAGNQLHIPTPAATTDTLDLYEEQVIDLKNLYAKYLAIEFRVSEIPSALVSAIQEAENSLEADNNVSLEVDMSDLSFSYKYNILSDR